MIQAEGKPLTLVEPQRGSPAVLLAWAKSQVLVSLVGKSTAGLTASAERTEPALTPEGIKEKKLSTGTDRMQSPPRPHHLMQQQVCISITLQAQSGKNWRGSAGEK